MNKTLLWKEWKQARLNVLCMLATICGVWLATFYRAHHSAADIFRAGGGDDEQPFLALLALFAGLQLAVAQFASESLWKTRDLLAFRASGPAAAFRAKSCIGAAATTLFVVGPVIVLFTCVHWTSPAAVDRDWSRALEFAMLGTLAWAAWGLGAFCCQLRHGWGMRIVVVSIASAGLYGGAARASAMLATTPPWMNALFPLGSAMTALFLACCAGRAFASGVDEDSALRNGPGLAMALGIALALGVPIALVGSSFSRLAANLLHASFRHIVEVEGAELSLAERRWDRTTFVGRWIYEPAGKPVFDPDWIHWGWPEPEANLSIVRPSQPFSLRGHLIDVGGSRQGMRADDDVRTEVFYESRSRQVHVSIHRPEATQHAVLETGFSPSTLHVWPGPVLADLERKALTLVRVEGENVALEPLALPDGDQFVGVERLVTRAWAEVGYRAPFNYENGLLIRGERGLYRLNQGVLEPYVAGPDDGSVAASVADGLVRLRSRYGHYDGLDPAIEVLDAQSGERIFMGKLAPPGLRTEALEALACAASLLHAPIASLASFRKEEPWRDRSTFDNPSLLGGRRGWLLVAGLGLGGWLAWRVRRETRAWGRSPLLGAFWVGATLLLGLVGWALFRISEPRPAHVERAAAPRKPRSRAAAELAAPAGVSR